MPNPSAGPQPADNPHETLDRICRDRTGADGTFKIDDVLNDMSAWLIGHPKVMADRAKSVARLLFRAYDDRRRPRRAHFQPGLFHPESLIPIAPKVRVWMEHATREHLIAWAAIDDKEFAASATAHAEKSAYRASRLDSWKSHHTELLDVERDEFGWVPSEGLDDDDLDDNGN